MSEAKKLLEEIKPFLEGTWSLPDTPEKVKELKKLMEKPILKKDANTVLFDLMGDDMLFDFFDELDDDDDVRPAVYDHLKRMSKMKRSGFRKPEALDFINQLVKDLKEFE